MDGVNATGTPVRRMHQCKLRHNLIDIILPLGGSPYLLVIQDAEQAQTG